jgi:farnesyl diphosphate synthase
MFQVRLKECSGIVEAMLDQVFETLPDSQVKDAMRYASTGGKRLRAFLVLESAALFHLPVAVSGYAAVAVELLHAYSLIHDDLPCMDDDDLRRGLPTVHVKWDQATAVLAGDGLQALAFECLTLLDLDPKIRINLIYGLAKAAGASGMVLGQAQDIAAETAPAPLTLEQITELQSNKTGALIRWSASAGAIMAAKDEKPLLDYANALGLAFQIQDDILDVEGDTALVGKRLQKDFSAGKATFVTLLGLDGAKTRAKELVALAQNALDCYDGDATALQEAARFVISRQS